MTDKTPALKTPQQMLEALAVEFPMTARKSRRGGDGKNLTYIEGTTVMRRLNAATNGEWTFEIVSQDMQPFGTTNKGDDRLMLTARARLSIPGLGTREHMGVQVVNATNGGEDLWKGAITDALKKAATLFGVGLELYGPDYEVGEIESPADTNTSRFKATPNAPAPVGPRYTMDPGEEQALLDQIASADGQDDWNTLITQACDPSNPVIREVMWTYLAQDAPTMRALKYLHSCARIKKELTPAVSAAMNYRSESVTEIAPSQQEIA